jgi:membrane protease YdiL (CAAX protease family)
LLAVSIIGAIAIAVAGEAREVKIHVEMAASVMMALVTVIWCCVARRDVAPLLKRFPPPQWLLAGAALGACTMFLAHSIVVFLNHIAKVPMIGYLEDFVAAGYGFGVAVAVIAVQPAIFEELAFRGVILSALEPVVGSREGLVVSALMFAILHVSVPSIPHLFVMGMALAWLKQKTRSLYPCMALHFAHNFLVLLSEKHAGFLPW